MVEESQKEQSREFTQRFMPLLDRGFILAFTQSRDTWTKSSLWSGDLTAEETRKQLAVGDFIDCVQHLLREGYTSASKLAVLVSSLMYAQYVIYRLQCCQSSSFQQFDYATSH